MYYLDFEYVTAQNTCSSTKSAPYSVLHQRYLQFWEMFVYENIKVIVSFLLIRKIPISDERYVTVGLKSS